MGSETNLVLERRQTTGDPDTSDQTAPVEIRSTGRSGRDKMLVGDW